MRFDIVMRVESWQKIYNGKFERNGYYL